MSDITMCRQSSCKRRKNCYRYLAVPNPRYQSYSDWKLCVKGHADQWPTVGMNNLTVRQWRDVDNEIAKKKAESTGN